MTQPWTPELDAELKRLWAMNMTRAEIGAAMGKTAMAVKARAHKLKLLSNAAFLPWPPEKERELAELWAADVPIPKIAAMFGLSNRAIKTKTQRLKLPSRQTVRETPHKQFRAFRVFTKNNLRLPPSVPRPLPTTVPEPDMKPVSLFERTGCAWAVTDSKPHLFCNHPTEHTYCEHHRQRMYRPW